MWPLGCRRLFRHRQQPLNGAHKLIGFVRALLNQQIGARRLFSQTKVIKKPAEKNDGVLKVASSQSSNKGDAIHARHSIIGYDQIELMPIHKLQGFPSARSGGNAIAKFFQNCSACDDTIGIVIHQENVGRLGRAKRRS